MPQVLLDAAGRPRSPAAVPGYHSGRSPRNKGQRYPADPPTVAEIVAVMRHAGTGVYGARLREHELGPPPEACAFVEAAVFTWLALLVPASVTEGRAKGVRPASPSSAGGG